MCRLNSPVPRDSQVDVVFTSSRIHRETQDLLGDFWAGLEGYPLLQAVAVQPFSSACYIATSERNLSTHKFIRSTLHTRLKLTTVEMVVHLFFNDRNVDGDELWFIDEVLPESGTPEPNSSSDYIYNWCYMRRQHRTDRSIS